MSEQHPHNHTAEVKPVNPLEVPQTVDRNGVSETLTVFKGQRGTWEGKFYQAPQIKVDGTDSLVASDSVFCAGLNFIGKSNVKNFLNTILKRIGQDYVEDAIGAAGTPDEGIFSMDRFITFWTNLKSSAMKLSELQETYQEEVENYKTLTTEFIAKIADLSPEQIAECKKAIEASGRTLNSLKAEFEERKAKRSKEAAAETVAAV